jgi:hypothetical protein
VYRGALHGGTQGKAQLDALQQANEARSALEFGQALVRRWSQADATCHSHATLTHGQGGVVGSRL